MGTVKFDYLGGGVMMAYCDFALQDKIAQLPCVTYVEEAVSHLSIYLAIGHSVEEAQSQIRQLVEGGENETLRT